MAHCKLVFTHHWLSERQRLMWVCDIEVGRGGGGRCLHPGHWVLAIHSGGRLISTCTNKKGPIRVECNIYHTCVGAFRSTLPVNVDITTLYQVRSWPRHTSTILSAQVSRLAPLRPLSSTIRCCTHQTQSSSTHRRRISTDAARRALIYDTSTRQWIRSPSTKLNLNLGALQRLGGREAKSESLLDPAESQLEQRPATSQDPQDAEEEDTLAGIVLPRRPEPPGDEDCCQSGCVSSLVF